MKKLFETYSVPQQEGGVQMAIWVCRTGNQGQYEKTFYENSAIYYTRDGFDFDLAQSSKDVVISRLSELMKSQ